MSEEKLKQMREKSRLYRANNKEKVTEYNRRYRASNPEKMKAAQKSWSDRHPGYRQAKSVEWHKSVKGRLCAYKGNTVHRHRQWDLTDEFATSLMKGDCKYCGRTPKEQDWNGIDRVDNKVHYVESNAVSCCKECNISKGKMTADAFIAMCKRVADHNE